MADYISREAAVKIAQKYGLVNGSALGRHTGLADCIAIEIEGLPAADVEFGGGDDGCGGRGAGAGRGGVPAGVLPGGGQLGQ